MHEVIEIARLIVVKLGDSIPWCVVDPQRWGAFGAPGETTMLYVMSYTLPEERPINCLNYLLHGTTVTLTLYRQPVKGSSTCGTSLRLDGKVTLPVALRSFNARTGAIARRHPELEVRLENNNRMVNYPYAFVSCGSGNPPWLGLLLVEPVTLLRDAVETLEWDLFCQASGIS